MMNLGVVFHGRAEWHSAQAERRSALRSWCKIPRPSAARPHGLQIILEVVQQVIRKAVGAMAFAVFLDFGDHAAQRLSIDAFFPNVLKNAR